jgi:hypothetical protein
VPKGLGREHDVLGVEAGLGERFTQEFDEWNGRGHKNLTPVATPDTTGASMGLR